MRFLIAGKLASMIVFIHTVPWFWFVSIYDLYHSGATESSYGFWGSWTHAYNKNYTVKDCFCFTLNLVGCTWFSRCISRWESLLRIILQSERDFAMMWIPKCWIPKCSAICSILISLSIMSSCVMLRISFAVVLNYSMKWVSVSSGAPWARTRDDIYRS